LLLLSYLEDCVVYALYSVSETKLENSKCKYDICIAIRLAEQIWKSTAIAGVQLGESDNIQRKICLLSRYIEQEDWQVEQGIPGRGKVLSEMEVQNNRFV
jgi:hypothetical protein